ncbi:MAG: hypothetical protein CMC96_08165 [Flavobacteriales bacterium]|nr:hypothetical protein [Flavobacteriales bacterium]|tara:strand:- start:79605 stop:80885 length:1281 start_codon:yes stop_codon:yes gene_type:complete
MKVASKLVVAALATGMSLTGFAQQDRSMQFYRPDGQDGLNVFETSKEDTVEFKGINVRLGGDFTIQFQGLSQENSGDSLNTLGSDFNLPTANMDIDVQLEDGVRLHLRTYLSSRNHNDSWVKGGHLQIDKLDFINEGFLSGFMEMATIRVGLDEFNYGDAHFRRSDNGNSIYNPFVGNYIMDAFSTEVFGELTLQKNGFIGVVGLTNGKLNQSTVVNSNPTDPNSEDEDRAPSIFGKLGYDKQINDDFRFRLTGSFYSNQGEATGGYLYGGDRAGARYYNVMDDNYTSGRYNPRFKKLTAIQINPFVKYKGLEFFGVYEMISGGELENETKEGSFTQLGAELLYRFGGKNQFYVGGRYNSVSGEQTEDAETQTIDRMNVGGGWFLTKNVVTKVEYMTQSYSGKAYEGSKYEDGSFNGVMIEAAISF